jgi:hypothetical protein
MVSLSLFNPILWENNLGRRPIGGACDANAPLFFFFSSYIFSSFQITGLMISALAKAGTILARDTYVKRATKAAEFVRQHLYDRQSGCLLRSCYRGQQQENVVSQKYVTFDFLFIITARTHAMTTM